MKILPLSGSRSLRSMPGPRGFEPTSKHASVSLNATRGSSEHVTSVSSGNAQSSRSILTPSSAPSTGVTSRSCRATFWLGPKMPPLAIIGRREYPICPAAPVTATRFTLLIQPLQRRRRRFQGCGSFRAAISDRNSPRSALVDALCHQLLVDDRIQFFTHDPLVFRVPEEDVAGFARLEAREQRQV